MTLLRGWCPDCGGPLWRTGKHGDYAVPKWDEFGVTVIAWCRLCGLESTAALWGASMPAGPAALEIAAPDPDPPMRTGALDGAPSRWRLMRERYVTAGYLARFVSQNGASYEWVELPPEAFGMMLAEPETGWRRERTGGVAPREPLR